MKLALRMTAAAALATGVTFIAAPPAGAVAPTSAACIGQFFSSHAGLGAAHTGETVGSFISAVARELHGEVGAQINGTRTLPRDDCGL